ncbi:Protein giant-lens like protein [Argiope bruennichi]|uniref:Protein giant-lens like protein n=1 Tax=Argiope bruennichi TaxID=94029 RepID=A0A8T0FLC4_ARGBR|nr:Protein giant-lens like protein [Argiope bruennichi]
MDSSVLLPCIPTMDIQLVDRTRQYKVCEKVDTLPTCRFFKDITWTHITSADNKFQQRVHCKCPENSTTYISGHDVKTTSQGVLYYYHFSCSPESGMRCRRKEPCRLFTVRKRYPVRSDPNPQICAGVHRKRLAHLITRILLCYPILILTVRRTAQGPKSGFCGNP